MYICALLNPNILVANIQGIDVNLTDAMELLFTSGIIYYAGKDLKKLKDLLQIDSSKQEGGEYNAKVLFRNGNAAGDTRL